MTTQPEIQAFLARVDALPPGPGASLDAVLQPSLDDEAELRRLFATDRQNPRLSDPHVGLVDVFAAPASIRTTRARVVHDKADLSARYVMPLRPEHRRADGAPCMAADLAEFQRNWGIFTEGALSQLADWRGVVAAGGAVLACLAPLDDAHTASKRAIRKHYHSKAYPTSDVDLFLWGMNAEQAEAKIKAIYEAVRDSVPWDVTCIRTKHTVSIHSQYPYRSIQIVLRLYQSPAEILAGFDIDAPCVAYVGGSLSEGGLYEGGGAQQQQHVPATPPRVLASPRAVVAMMRQCNTVDVTRRSPSYELRLAKYAARGYEVYVPAMRRAEIDPTIFERAIARMEGLARLLVLEKLGSDTMRTAFLAHRRKLRGRPSANTSYSRRNARRYKGDLKVESELAISVVSGEMNDYDVAALHIPYGPGWDARRIEKLVYQTDLGMNSTFNPKNKGRRLHRHPAFFGTVEECLDDCCEHCPEPIDDDERALQKEEDEIYVRGRITFVEENPGRQSITGSFRPIDDGEWSAQVYIRPTQRLFAAIAARDRAAVQALLLDAANPDADADAAATSTSNTTATATSTASMDVNNAAAAAADVSDVNTNNAGIDVNNRDHVGRTVLHVAILARATDIACDLIDAGARVTARLADGRAPLHLAAQYDLPGVVEKLFERSAVNKAAEEEKKGKAAREAEKEKEAEQEKEAEGKATADAAKASSEDDWSSHDDEDVVMSEADEEEDDEDDAEKDKKDGAKDDDEDKDGDDDDGSSSSDNDGEEKPEDAGEIPEEKDDQPDIIEVDAFDWDIGFSAIAYAVLYASVATLDALLRGGADPTVPTKQGNYGQPLHPLALTILRHDEEDACNVAERLLQIGAVTSTTANPQLRTIFHFAVRAGRTKLLETMLRCDANAATALNFPAVQGSNVVFPVVTALSWSKFPALAVMLAHGARLELVEEDVTKALDVGEPHMRQAVSNYGSITNYLYAAYQPLEVAAAAGNDISKLLITLGASIDFGLKRAMGRYSGAYERRTVKDWVHFAISSLDVTIQTANKSYQEKKDKKVEDTSEAKPDSMVVVRTGWKGFYDQYVDTLQQHSDPHVPAAPESAEKKAERDAKNHRENIQRLEDLKAFFLDIEAELNAHNAKTWREVHPSISTEARVVCAPPIETKPAAPKPQVEPPKVVEEEKTHYIQLHNSYLRTSVPEHLIKRYDELFEACFAGDNATIQRLCLPVDGQDGIVSSETPLPLDISVKMMDRSTSRYEHYGYTPLFAAIAGRKWSTAKLILAIATAQYAPENKKDAIKFRLSLEDSDDEGDSDAESDDSDMTIEQEEVKFIDIARRPSSVRSQVHPSKMLTEYVRWARPKASSPIGLHYGTSNPLDFTVVHDDLEAFVHIANLYATLPDPVDLPSATLALILQHDRPDILDEYIRRTGSGIDLDDAKQGAGGEEDLPSATNDANKLYLGLNVHGKKRMDLARKNDPDASGYEPDKEHPLLWQAIQLRAKGVIDYLHSDRPVLAFKFYAHNHSDPKALWLKRLLVSQDGGESALAKKLPLWLGWTTNSVGESPLIVAILSNNIDMVKQVAKLDAQLVTKALQSRIKFVGVNPVLLAVRKQCNEKIHDYLLSRKVSPSERTTNDGWNIYHHLCELNNGDLLEYYLEKLPVDVTAPLLIQQSKPRMNTPLHIAIKKGHKRLVRLLLGHESITPALLLKDVDGQIPLHCAVKCYWTDITTQLLAASPAEALFTEDAVGNTLFDTISLAELTTRLTSFGSLSMNISEASPSSHDTSNAPMKVFLENEKHIAEMLASLETSAGRYKAKIVAAIQKWQASRADRLVVYKERQAVLDEAHRLEEEERKRKEAEKAEKERRRGAARPNPTDYGNVTKVWKLVTKALGKHAGADTGAPKRHLVHLFEVQQSVAVALSKARGEQAEDDADDDYSYRRRSRRQREEEGLEPEEDNKEKSERQSSLVFQYLRNGVDTY